jgi:O-antigen/teichoic acid export membrane protein
MLEKKLIIRGIYLNYVYLFVGLILSFLLTPIIIHSLGQAAYGLWVVFGSIVGYLGLLDFGMNVSTVKYTAEFHARNEQDNLNKHISTIFLGFVLIGILIILVCFGLAPFIPGLFNIPEDLVSVGRIAFLMMGLNVALGLLGATFGNMIYGYQRVDAWKTIGIIQAIANASFVIVFLQLGFGLIGVVVASLLTILISIGLYLLFLRRSNYGIVISPKLADFSTIKKIAPYSIRSFVLSLTSQVLYYTDNIVIGIFLGASVVTKYSVAYRLCFFATYIFSVITQTIFPTFTKLYAMEDSERLKSLYLKTVKISIAIMVPIGLFLGFFGRSFINLWVGEENFVGINALLVLIFMDFLHSFGTPPGLLLQAIGKNKAFVYSEILNASLNLLLSIILVTKIGLIGVALGTLFASACTSSWIVPLLACKHTGLPVKRYLLSGVLPPLLAGIPVGAISWLFIKDFLPNQNLFYLGLKGILISVIYLAIYLPFVATHEEQRMYLGFFRSFGRRQYNMQ